MSPAFVSFFTIMLIVFAVYGFFSFMITLNRSLKKSVNKSKRKEKPRNNEKTED